MKFKYLIINLLFSTLIYAQNYESDWKNHLERVDSIVDLININEKKYKESIVEGTIIHKSILRKNGAWEAYFLYKNENENPPLRIIYNEAENKTYQNFEFYYQNGELIFAKLNVKFYRGKRKDYPIEKEFYFKDSETFFQAIKASGFYLNEDKKKRIFNSNYNSEIYGIEYIKKMEKKVREIIIK